MPVDKQVIERYRVLNECFRNPYRDYTIDDLVDECNKALRRLDKPEVSKRTIQTNPDLKGISFFSELLQAILAKRVLKLRYTPYGKETQTVTIYPYYLKQFNDRWYLIAQAKGYETYAHYALDRIDSYETVSLPYKEAEVDFSEYFDDVIGVTVPEEDAEDIVIKVSGKRFNYIRTKPIHLSQRIIEEIGGYAIISINVKVNKELESLILSFGDDVEVISPVSFRERIAEKIQTMNQRYVKRNDE